MSSRFHLMRERDLPSSQVPVSCQFAFVCSRNLIASRFASCHPSNPPDCARAPPQAFSLTLWPPRVPGSRESLDPFLSRIFSQAPHRPLLEISPTLLRWRQPYEGFAAIDSPLRCCPRCPRCWRLFYSRSSSSASSRTCRARLFPSQPRPRSSPANTSQVNLCLTSRKILHPVKVCHVLRRVRIEAERQGRSKTRSLSTRVGRDFKLCESRASVRGAPLLLGHSASCSRMTKS